MKNIIENLKSACRIPGGKAAAVRLCLVCATLVIGITCTFLALISAESFSDMCLAFFTGITVSIMMGAIIWGFAKWTAYIFPKSLAVARRFWSSLYALSILALAVKAMVWIYLVLMPVTLYSIALLPVFLVVAGLAQLGIPVLGEAILILLCISALLLMVLKDVCLLRGQSFKSTLFHMMHSTNVSIRTGAEKMLAMGKR